MILLSTIKYHEDHRGVFFEIPNENEITFKQTSISMSKKNTLRGLHYQWNGPMGKKVTLIKGEILECILDINKKSATFGQTMIFKCSKKQNTCFYIPAGYAHGFLALKETILLYQQTCKYNKACEGCINPLDKDLNIPWGLDSRRLIISDRDSEAPSFEEYQNKNIIWSIS